MKKLGSVRFEKVNGEYDVQGDRKYPLLEPTEELIQDMLTRNKIPGVMIVFRNKILIYPVNTNRGCGYVYFGDYDKTLPIEEIKKLAIKEAIKIRNEFIEIFNAKITGEIENIKKRVEKITKKGDLIPNGVTAEMILNRQITGVIICPENCKLTICRPRNKPVCFGLAKLAQEHGGIKEAITQLLPKIRKIRNIAVEAASEGINTKEKNTNSLVYGMKIQK